MRVCTLVFGLSLVFGACSNGGGNNSGECDEGATQCAGNTFQSCEGGAWVTTDQCLGLCDPGLGCVDCNPGTNFCVGNDVHACDDAGNDSGATESCGDLFCDGGQCRDLCADAVESDSYIGCEYFAVDLDNAVEVIDFPGDGGSCSVASAVIDTADVCVDAENNLAGQCDTDGSCPTDFSCSSEDVCVLDAQGSPFAIVVANPQAVELRILIENSSGESQEIPVGAGEVNAIFPQQLGFPDQSVDGTSQAPGAYRLSSHGPFVAYQFNPLDNEDVFSNDGALLLPVHTFDSSYLALSLPSMERRPQLKDFNGYLTVVAEADDTSVTVTPSAAVRAGPTMGAIAAGEPTTFTLDAFDVLNLEAVGGGDLTGSQIESDDPAKPIGVFAGHEAVTIPGPQVLGNPCCADHLEHMMFPTSTWGTAYAIARSQQRTSEEDLVRILAQQDNTVVTLSSGSCPTLMAGEFCEIDVSGDLAINADKPIMVGHFLRSVGETFLGFPVGDALGDPSMSLAVPVEQYRSQYSFLVPNDYDTQYIGVVAAAGSVTLDGDEISDQLTPFGPGDLSAARIEVQPGQHELSCADGCGVTVYGYSNAVSYMFPAGLDLQRIVVD